MIPCEEWHEDKEDAEDCCKTEFICRDSEGETDSGCGHEWKAYDEGQADEADQNVLNVNQQRSSTCKEGKTHDSQGTNHEMGEGQLRQELRGTVRHGGVLRRLRLAEYRSLNHFLKSAEALDDRYADVRAEVF